MTTKAPGTALVTRPDATALGKLAADVAAGFGSVEAFELLQRGAKLLASSTLVPKEYQGNLPNCVIALNMSQRIGADPLMTMQNLYIVHGRPGWSAQFLIATFNQNGRFTALRYEWIGTPSTETYGCRAWAIEKETGEKLVGATITLALAKAEGGTDKAGSKWKTMPEQMLMYRSAAWFIRAYAPEIAMGLHTVDEITDTILEAERVGPSAYAAVPVVVTPETLTGGTTTGENGVEPGQAGAGDTQHVTEASGSERAPEPPDSGSGTTAPAVDPARRNDLITKIELASTRLSPAKFAAKLGAHGLALDTWTDAPIESLEALLGELGGGQREGA